jgi:hypothetical protein
LALAIVASKSFARRRFRLSQARVRSTTQRRGSSTKPAASAARQQYKAGSVSGAFDDLDGPLAKFGECVTQVGAIVWSSTRAQIAGGDNELVAVAPLRALIPDFAVLLAMPTDSATITQIERGPNIGRPLGRPEWIAMLQRRLGRPLAPVNPA